MKKLILLLALLTAKCSFAQHTPLKITGYLETYYGFDFNKPTNNYRPGFIYSHNRHNEVTLNLGYIKAAYETKSLRANLAIMTGTYANANLSAEPGIMKNIFEANAGVKLLPTTDLWLDAGVFSSHIGYESAISKDCWVVTRNIASENTPYYESGLRISYATEDKKLSAAALVLNGWQRIQRQDGNSRPAVGIQLTWRPVSALTLNYSNYLGTEGPDSAALRRFYNNVYGIIQITRDLGITAGLDYGIQQQSKNSDNYNVVVSPVAVIRYQMAEKWALAARCEYYQDKHGVFIPQQANGSFSTRGYSMNLDYAPAPNALLRVEGKVYDSNNRLFTRGDNLVNVNALITASIAISF